MASPTPHRGQAWPHALDPRPGQAALAASGPARLYPAQPGAGRPLTAQPHDGWSAAGRPASAALRRGGGRVGGAATHRHRQAHRCGAPVRRHFRSWAKGQHGQRPEQRRRRHPSAGRRPAHVTPGRPHPSPAPSRPTVRRGWCSAPLRRTRPCHRQRARSRPQRQRPGRGRSMTGRPHTAALVTQAPMPGDVGHARKRDARRPGWAAWSGERRPAWITAQRRAPPIRCPARRDRRGAAPAGVGRRYPSVHCPGTPARPAAGYTPSDHRRRARAAQHAAGPACRCAEAPCRPGRGRE